MPPVPAAIPMLLVLAAGGQADVVAVRDVVYATATDRDGRAVELTMDAAFPARSGGAALPAIVYIHGGGFRAGSKEQGEPFARAAAQGGYFGAAINYRLSGQAGYPAAVHDAKAAIRFLRAHAEELGIDAGRIGVWGHSAGATLSALVATSGNDRALEGTVEPASHTSEVRCAVILAAATDFLRFERDASIQAVGHWLGRDPATFERNAREATPLSYLDGDDPPTLIVHGTDDSIVPVEQSDLFNEALQRVGVEVTYLRLPGARHVIVDPEAYRAVAAFFDEHLGGDLSAVGEFPTIRQLQFRGTGAERPRTRRRRP